MPEKKHAPRNPTGIGSPFRPSWKPENLPTSTLRIPDRFKDLLLRIARALDDGTITMERITLWLDNQYANIKILAELERINEVPDAEIVKKLGRPPKKQKPTENE